MIRQKTYNGHPALGVGVDKDTWLTPRWILDQLGAFDLDPCAAAIAPKWVGTAAVFTPENDGLHQPWKGRVFMNPPFSAAAKWIEKHADHGEGISLIPAAVESITWRKWIWSRSAAVFLLHGRVQFCNPDGSITSGRPLRGVALIAWSPRDTEILRKITCAGVLLENWRNR